MEVKIEITGIKELVDKMSDVEKRQVPFAVKNALNKTAQMVQTEERREMKKILDKPTPYTLKSLIIDWATKSRKRGIKLEATVLFTDKFNETMGGIPAANYMMSQVMGMPRNQKRFERALQAKGILPKGMYVAPGAGCKLDAYGNIPNSLINQIISYFGASYSDPYNATNPKRKAALAKGSKRKGTMGFEYFVSHGPGTDGGRQHLPAGIYKRVGFAKGSTIKPIFMFVKQPSYKKKFPFYEIAKQTINRWGMRYFNEELAKAMVTARLK